MFILPLILHFFTVALSAPLTIPSPSELLSKCKKSRVDFIEAVTDFQQVVIKLESADLTYGYIDLLPTLKDLSIQYRIEELVGDPVKDLGRDLIKHATKWVRFDEVPSARISILCRWGDEESLTSMAQLQSKYLLVIDKKDPLLKWYGNSHLFIRELVAAKKSSAVRQAYDELQGILIRKILKLKTDLANEDKSKIVAQTQSAISIQEVIFFLQQEILVHKEKASVELLMQWTLILGRNLYHLPEVVPLHLKISLGSILVDGAMYLLSLGHGLPEALCLPMFDYLLPNHVSQLGQQITEVYLAKTVPEDMVDSLWLLVDRLLKKFEEYNLLEKSKDLQKIHQRLAMAKVIRNGNFEGTYDINLDGAKATLTLCHLGTANFIGALRLSDATQNNEMIGTTFSFFHVAYNSKDSTYEAHRYAVDSVEYMPPTLKNYFMKFTFKEDGPRDYSIMGKFTKGGHFHMFKGKRVEIYPTYNSDGAVKLDSVLGIYTGAVLNEEAELTLTQVGERISAIFAIPMYSIRSALAFGYLYPNKNIVYVTSGELDGSKWVQIRGQVKENGGKFQGHYIVGGVGLKTSLDLRKKE